MASLATTVLRNLTSPRNLTRSPECFGASHIAATAAMTLATLRRACELQSMPLREQRIVIRGAGARGLAVARAIIHALQETGMTWRQASAQVFVVDANGLIMEGPSTSTDLRRYATPADLVTGWSFKRTRPNLLETVANSGATVLIGLSGQDGAFGREIVSAMSANVEHPIIFPFSWPEGRREASPEDVREWSGGSAMVVGPDQGPQGSDCIEGWTLPGLALGTLIAEADAVDEEMVLAAARAMHDVVAAEGDRLVPGDDEFADTTLAVAQAVVRAALRTGAAANLHLSFSGLDDYVADRLRDGATLPTPRDDDGWEGLSE